MLNRRAGMIAVLSALHGAPAMLRAQPVSTGPSTTTTARLTTRPTMGNDLQTLGDVLWSDAAPQSERDEAARRLVLRQSDQAKTILERVLQAAANRPGQLSVAKALAGDPHPDARFINPLFALIGTDRQLTDAATMALGNYKSNHEVLSRLINFTQSSQGRDIRMAAIRTLGMLTEKRAASALMALLNDPDQNDATRNAVMDALASMTGFEGNARDPHRWKQWWETAGTMDDTAWRLALLDDRAVAYDQMQARLAQMRDEVQSILTSQYQSLSESQRAEALLRYFKSADPAIRVVAARIVYDDAINSRPVPTAVREQLRDLIGDGAPEVRFAVAKALQVINDPEALGALLAQLSFEPEADVRAELAKSLATIGDVRAVPELIKLLGDPSRRVAEAGARALRDMGGAIRAANSELVRSTASALREALRSTEQDPASEPYREGLVEAMSVLRSPSLRDVYYGLLDQRTRQPTGLRRAAVEALGELRDPKVADVLANALDDREEVVRLEAIRALGKTSTFAQAEAIYAHLSPGNESSERVRTEAWRVLQSLLPDANKEQLQEWARRFVSQPERRVIILKALSDKQVQDKDLEQLALTRQNIGEAYMNLNQPADAAIYFRNALEYWQSRSAQEMVTQGLVRQTLEALLRSKQYDAAMKFAQPLIAEDAKNQEVVGALIRSEANRLLEAEDYAAVINLTGLTEKMSPALDSRYATVLHGMAEQARQRLADQQRGPTSGGPRSALAQPVRPGDSKS